MSVNSFNPIIKLLSVDSTNNYATARLETENWTEGTLVLSENQTAGRGQVNNSWQSETGKNILASMVFYPTFLPIQFQFLLSKTIALAIHELVSLYADNVSIKWPNDIYIGQKKVAGILLENAILGSKINWAVAGIGLNVNQKVFSSGVPNPTSLALEVNREFIIDEVVLLMIDLINKWYQQLKSGNLQYIDEEYISKLYRFGVTSVFSDSEGQFTGKITGINPYGHLIVLKESGELNSYATKEISFIA